jgi:hypothetical protein
MASNKDVSRCRNCGDVDHLQDLGFIGQVSPFFLRRVMGVNLGKVRSVGGLKQMVRKMVGIPQKLLERINQPTAFVEVQICDACTFVQTKRPFHEEDINRLYADYREESYNRERIECEPWYASMASEVGHATLELEARLSAQSRFFEGKLRGREGFTILDFGGSDGKFMPRLEGEKFVFEISNVEPVPGVTRLRSDAELGTYSLVQLAHVVEHVVEPLGLTRYVASKVAPGGYLYVETPQEISESGREELRQGRRLVGIHEHINSFCPQAVRALMERAGLKVVAIEATPVDVGWAKAVHIRALAQKV